MNGVQPKQLQITNLTMKDMLQGTKESSFAKNVNESFEWTIGEKAFFAGACVGTGGIFLLLYGAIEIFSWMLSSAKPKAEVKQDINDSYASLKNALYNSLKTSHEHGELELKATVSVDFIFDNKSYTYEMTRDDKENSLKWVIKEARENSDEAVTLLAGSVPSEKSFIEVLNAMNPLYEPFDDFREWYKGVASDLGQLSANLPVAKLVENMTEQRAKFESKIELVYDESTLSHGLAKQIAHERDFVPNMSEFAQQKHRESYDSMQFGGNIGKLKRESELSEDSRNTMRDLYGKNPNRAENIWDSINARMDGFNVKKIEETLDTTEVALLQPITMAVEKNSTDAIAHPHVLSLVAPTFNFAKSGKITVQESIPDDYVYSKDDYSFNETNVDLNMPVNELADQPDENAIAYRKYGDHIVNAARQCKAQRVVLSVAGMDSFFLAELGGNREKAKNIAADSFVEAVIGLRRLGKEVVLCDDYGVDYLGKGKSGIVKTEFWELVNEELQNKSQLPLKAVQSKAKEGEGWVKDTDMLVNNMDRHAVAGSSMSEHALRSRTTLHFGAIMASRDHKLGEQERNVLLQYQPRLPVSSTASSWLTKKDNNSENLI